MCIDSFSVGIQSFMNSVTSLDPMFFSGFQNIFISKDLFQDKYPHVSVGVTWSSEMLIEFVVLYMVSILIFHVNCIDMLSSPGFDVDCLAQILGQSTNVAFNPVDAHVCPTSQVLCNLDYLSCCLHSEL